ncbi:glycine oxidase ThiO [Phytoactinopolyspora limicola]|uniref:glycine oxidase ThiO n=1 Tax=Phytoactinopolyspora limicola TaxID=2715536 RepID=UPI00140884EB|nr:glycine oxidase ThiO [Phytoactinopolyspora limicola]
MDTGDTTDVIVVGCGIIGASVAWQLARRGAVVRCLDPHPGDGSTYAAAGMLAAVTETTFGEHELMRLNLEAAAMWPDFATQLEAETGQPCGLRRTGTLTLAFDGDDRQQLRRLHQLHVEWGLDAREITTDAARQMEPTLGPRLAAAIWAPGDHQVDPRSAQKALLTALMARKVDIIERAVERVLPGTAVTGPSRPGVVDTNGQVHRADLVVVAAGWNSRLLAPGCPTRPVKGQVARLDARAVPTFQLTRVVRGLVQDRPVYLVPRADGEIVVGGTSEEQPDNRQVTAGGAFALLRDARALVPGIDELPVTELTARARPGSPDNLPLIGDAGPPGIVLATGHYRNGVLLAPLTAAAVAARWADGKLPDSVSAAHPARFHPTHDHEHFAVP